jgi:predicted O-methyltransferase YrrM
MSSSTVVSDGRQIAIVSGNTAWQPAVFAGATFFSAFLLFQVQPLIGKFILPWFGGSPAVWTTCMLFFQVVLFLGYAYAHATCRWLSLRGQMRLHLALVAVALLSLPIMPDVSWKPSDSEQPAWRILLLLAVTIGLPYFVLSSTGPLLQAWFGRVSPGRSQYRLYSLSNAGSLLALVSFPLLVEPAWTSTFQARLWSNGFVVFGLLCVLCAWWAGHAPTASPSAGAQATGDEPAPAWRRRALWLLLPGCSCLMLLATTNEVCQNVAPIPFLWVVPLALYLVSFIICFDHARWYRRGPIAAATLVAIWLVAGLNEWPDWFGLSLGTRVQLLAHFAALFGVCMVCHGELVRSRPAAKYLTEFYLMLSAGGALGGIFVSLLAPVLFTTYFEWPIGLVLSFVVAAVAGWCALERPRRGAKHLLAPCARPLVIVNIVGGIAALVLIVQWQFQFTEALYEARNFYGTLFVADSTSGQTAEPYRALICGSITHGRQWTAAAKRSLPTCYYHEATAPGLAFARLQSRPKIRAGVIGLGVGTLATFLRPADEMRIYEINPEVQTIARTYFTFLSDCRGKCDVVLGDARLELEREAPQQFDILILDAFTSDAPPVHLLTKEAFEIYLKHLKPHGLLVVHVTNTYLDLAPVVERVGSELKLKARRIRTPANYARLHYRTDYVVLGRDAPALGEQPAEESAAVDDSVEAPLWTDQFSNLYQVLRDN